MTRRSVLFFMSAAVGASTIGVGCNGGGDQIPLAKIEPSKETGKQAGKASPPKNGKSSPSELIYK